MESKPLDTSKPRGISRENRAFFKRLGKRIARLREAKSQSQAELANVLGVAEEVVISIELGERRPPLNSMPKLAACLGIAISDLVADDQLSLPSKMQLHLETLKKLSKADQRFVTRLTETLAQSSRPSEARHGS
jgi:transcriptional regulator with XRE-family HTH domain